MKTAIIVQARSNSKRFPKKIFYKIGHKSILEHVIDRIKKAKFKKVIIIATTKKKPDKKVIKYAKKNNCLFYAGSENNVLERFYKAAKKFKIKNLIRISADSPFIDPRIIEKAYKIYKNGKYDYVSNTIDSTYPKGMSVEFFNFKSIESAYNSAISKYDQEHVTPFIFKRSNIFRLKNFKLKKSYRKYRFTVDYRKDLILYQKIYRKICQLKIDKVFSMKNLIFLKKNKGY